jgi:hypothetical protein
VVRIGNNSQPSETRYALKMNAFSITSLCGTNRWPWEAARPDFRLQSKPNKEQMRLLRWVVPRVTVCSTLEEENTGGKH